MLPMRTGAKQEKLREVLILSVLILLAINIPLISAYILTAKFGTFTLYPGEKYTLNLPFIGPSRLATICGTAEQTNGTLLAGVNITLKYYNNNTSLAKNVTGSNGRFCFTLNTTSDDKFDIYLDYDNSTLTLGSTDYDLNFDDNLVHHKSTEHYVALSGEILNEDATVEDGRLEIKMGQKVNGTWKYTFGDYQSYYLNIDPSETYQIPNSELNFSKNIDSLDTGEYKFLIKSSFNGKEKTSIGVFFNITD